MLGNVFNKNLFLDCMCWLYDGFIFGLNWVVLMLLWIVLLVKLYFWFLVWFCSWLVLKNFDFFCDCCIDDVILKFVFCGGDFSYKEIFNLLFLIDCLLDRYKILDI